MSRSAGVMHGGVIKQRHQLITPKCSWSHKLIKHDCKVNYVIERKRGERMNNGAVNDRQNESGRAKERHEREIKTHFRV
jgi:hypothetical protein